MVGQLGAGGFEPRTSPPERRDFFDLRRQITEINANLAALDTRVTTAETQLAAVPLGVIGYAQRTSDYSLTGSSTDITGLSVTFTAVAGRQYKATLEFEILQGAGSDIWVVGINEGSTVLERITGCNAQSIASNSYFGSYVNTGSISGSKTWKATGIIASGATVTVVAGAGGGTHYTSPPALLLIEDIGPL